MTCKLIRKCLSLYRLGVTNSAASSCYTALVEALGQVSEQTHARTDFLMVLASLRSHLTH